MNTTQKIKVIILGLAIGVGVYSASAVPTTQPGTVGYSPLNATSTRQIKLAGLALNSFLANLEATFQHNLTIGSVGNTSDVLNVGYDQDGQVTDGGSEVATNVILPAKKNGSVQKLCTDGTGALIVCLAPACNKSGLVINSPGYCYIGTSSDLSCTTVGPDKFDNTVTTTCSWKCNDPGGVYSSVNCSSVTTSQSAPIGGGEV